MAEFDAKELARRLRRPKKRPMIPMPLGNGQTISVPGLSCFMDDDECHEEAAKAILSLANRAERLTANIECLTNNKWSEIELALADKEAHQLWMDLHGIKSLDDLLDRAERAEKMLHDLLAAASNPTVLRVISKWADEIPQGDGNVREPVLAALRAAILAAHEIEADAARAKAKP